MASTTAVNPTVMGAGAAAAAGGLTGVITKQATMSAANASALRSVVACWTMSPHFTPRYCNTVKNTTTASPTPSDDVASDGISAPAYSPTRIAAAAKAATDDTQSLHPTITPAYDPNACRAKTYCPPDRGTNTPSSAREIVPSSAYTPPAIHARIKSHSFGSTAATDPGVRRIPDPIVLPTMTATPKATPSTCSSRPRLCCDTGSEALAAVAM